ncbi:MAG TPA: 50S ribosomal protein L20 [Acidobacteriota bacterium]|nr:50S ribosomal protein L20 [Acidobacteriota bacterium]
MPRVRGGTRKVYRRKKILKQAKGYYGARGRLYRHAKETVQRAQKFAYRDRRRRKRVFRRLWIVRINAASRSQGLSYSQLMNGLKQAGVDLDRKVLADMAIQNADAFSAVCETARTALNAN